MKMIYVLSVSGGPVFLKTLLFDNPAFVHATIDQQAVRVMIWCSSRTQNADDLKHKVIIILFINNQKDEVASKLI